MKYTLLSIMLMMSLGVAQAGSGRDMEREGTLQKSAPSTYESHSVQPTAVQPGMGDSVSRFDEVMQKKFDWNDGDWADLRNEEMYGSF